MKKLTQAEHLPIHKLKPFDGHPFYIKDDEDMLELTESIRSQGVLTPLVVRPLPNNEYEVISGHRRLHACKKAGIEMIPAFIYSMDRNEAVVAMVDSNLRREKLLAVEVAIHHSYHRFATVHRTNKGRNHFDSCLFACVESPMSGDHFIFTCVQRSYHNRIQHTLLTDTLCQLFHIVIIFYIERMPLKGLQFINRQMLCLG